MDDHYPQSLSASTGSKELHEKKAILLPRQKGTPSFKFQGTTTSFYSHHGFYGISGKSD